MMYFYIRYTKVNFTKLEESQTRATNRTMLVHLTHITLVPSDPIPNNVMNLEMIYEAQTIYTTICMYLYLQHSRGVEHSDSEKERARVN